MLSVVPTSPTGYNQRNMAHLSSASASTEASSSSEGRGSDSSDEEMSKSSEDCIITAAGRFPRADQDAHYYSDNNEDDLISASDPLCSKTFGLPAVSATNRARPRLSPIIKLLDEKQSAITLFLYKARNLSYPLFKEHFRIEHRVAEHLIWLMQSQGVFPYKSVMVSGGHKTPLKESDLNEFCFLLFLWYLSSTEPLLNISSELDIPLEHLWPLICHVASWIRVELINVVSWPVGARVIKAWKTFNGNLQKCIGAISSTHIAIKQPSASESPEEYRNQDGYYSVHLQVVATRDNRFTNIYCGDGGSLDVERVWKRSPLRANAKRKQIKPNDLFPDDSYLVGKHPYNLEDHILVPFKRPQGFAFRPAHFKFNMCHYFCFIAVEDAIKNLKGRFRRLMYVDYYSVDDVPDLITTCCLLHNYCLDYKDTFENRGSPFTDLSDRRYFDDGDEDFSTKALPKMEIGNDRRGRLIREELPGQLNKG